MNKDCYYFTHDSNAKDDPKCVLMIEQLGMEGYGIYWMLVETLRDQPDYTYPVANIPALARRYNTSAEKVRTVVYNYDLFKVKDDRIFFSESLNRRMQAFNEKRAKRSEAGRLGNASRWGASQTDRNAIAMRSQSLAIKVKESKVKEKESIEKVATKRAAFVAPSLQEVSDYISEKLRRRRASVRGLLRIERLDGRLEQNEGLAGRRSDVDPPSELLKYTKP